MNNTRLKIDTYDSKRHTQQLHSPLFTITQVERELPTVNQPKKDSQNSDRDSLTFLIEPDSGSDHEHSTDRSPSIHGNDQQTHRSYLRSVPAAINIQMNLNEDEHSEEAQHRRKKSEASQPFSLETPATSTTKTSTSRRTISFSTIEIKSFPLILGDNPSCDKNGPPLAIGWTPHKCEKYNVEKYEQRKQKKSIGKRSTEKIGGFFRQRILRSNGCCSVDEIYDRMDEMDKIRRSRRRNNLFYLWRRKFFCFTGRFWKYGDSRQNDMTSTLNLKSNGLNKQINF